MTAARRAAALLVVGLLPAGALAACGGDDSSTAPTLPPPVTTGPAVTEAPEPTEPPVTTAPATTVAPDAGPYEFEAVDGRVVAVFPAEPTESELPVEVPGAGVLASPLFMVESDDYAMFLSWTDFGTEIDDDMVFGVLEDARDGAIAGFGGELVSSDRIDVDGRAAVDFVGTVPFGATEARYQSIATIDGDRLYQVVSVSVAGSPADDLGRAFLDSFEFTGAPS